MLLQPQKTQFEARPLGRCEATILIDHHLHANASIDVARNWRKEVAGNDKLFLQSKIPVNNYSAVGNKTLSVVDLFCGAGGLSLGLHLAAAELGLKIDTRLAVDLDPAAVACYSKNFPDSRVMQTSVANLFESDLEAPFSDSEKKLHDEIGQLDVLAGGPPCQGHSDLNNFTRRNDPKNLLYLYMARAAMVLKPKTILIENVVGSLHDKNGVVQKVVGLLHSLGYYVDCDFLDFLSIGVPQKRRRLVITASRQNHPAIAEIQSFFGVKERNVSWAIRDLERERATTLMNTPSKPTATTQKRIDHLFLNNLYELPNSERPPCHRDKKHSYDTVYGRLRWDLPAQTITSGFYCMCMGRYVHPSQSRTLTAHEAARIQFFPDYFDFTAAESRTKIAGLIGNAVPPKGSYVLGLGLISSIVPQ